MANPIIAALHTFKAPESDFVNEESIRDLLEICPAVRSIMEGGDTATSNPANRGFLSAMGIIYDMIAGSGYEETLSGITGPFAERVDKLMISGKFSLIRDGSPIIPAILDLMKEKPKPFDGGILLALGCVVKRAEEDYGPAQTVTSYGIPEKAEALPKEETEAMPNPPEEKPKIDLNWAKAAKSMPRPDGITKVLGELNRLGIPLESISLRPEQTNSGIQLKIAIQFGESTTFEEIAKINATMMAVLGKPVTLKSAAGIWVQMSL